MSNSPNLARQIETLKAMIAERGRIVFFGGAGVSTESGIPDFRSEWVTEKTRKRYGLTPETILSRDFFFDQPEVFYDYVRSTLYSPDALPNPAHLALARLEEEGKLLAVITQNIDGLHQKAGSKRVFELHGTLQTFVCPNCGKVSDADDVIPTVSDENPVPLCDCGNVLKPEVVLYQEPLPEAAIAGAAEAIMEADMLIVAGTSLVVQPAASLISLFQGRDLVIINKTPTPADRVASLVIHAPVGEVLQQAVLTP